MTNVIKLIHIAVLLVLLICAGTATADQKAYSMNASARRFIGNARENGVSPGGSSGIRVGDLIGF